MLLLQALPAVVGALSELPPWLLCFGEVPCAFFLPVWAGRFDLFEIGMRIPLDGFFLVEALFVAGGILGFLFVVAGVFGCHCSETGWEIVLGVAQKVLYAVWMWSRSS